MPIKDRSYELTTELLQTYRDAAVVNSETLLVEAGLLLAHSHNARAYFLAVSSIEEAGKAVQAFEALGKNLNDPAVAQRIKLQFGDHTPKVTAAFLPWIQTAENPRERVMECVDLMVALAFGREAAMYTDINAEKNIVTTPQKQVSQHVASDCIRLATTVLSHVRLYVMQSMPKKTTKAHDELFALKPSIFQKLLNNADFWEYYLSKMESGTTAFDEAVADYNRAYLTQGKYFKSIDSI